MYRQKPESRGDSGWRFYAYDEAITDMLSPIALKPYELASIVDIDRRIARYLDEPVGSEFEQVGEWFKMLVE